MNKEFEVKAFFYKREHPAFEKYNNSDSNSWIYRKYANIVNKNSNQTEPQITVIMMNPGSSKSEGDIYDKEVNATVDPTMLRIQCLMRRCNLDYARIINLSDLCASNSKVFISLLEDEEIKKLPHSIFSKKREEELMNIINPNSIIIGAWGVGNLGKSSFKKLVEDALKKISNSEIIGQISGDGKKFCHPLPRSAAQQELWLNEVSTQLNSRLTSS